jgi:hypothetical protein
MPTNPLWIEHTEKAAWETVRALREQVEEERARADRLLRLEPTLPRIAELLEEARGLLGLDSQAPAVILEQLIARLRALGEERAALLRDLAARPSSPATIASAPPVAVASEPTASKKSNALRWFASQLERRRREREEDEDPEPARGSLAEVATRVDERLRELLPLPYAPAALRNAALDIGLAALDLARAARRAERVR